MRRKSYEVSYTYDGQLIVSERFKAFCENNHMEGTVFTLVNAGRGLYRLTSNRIVEFNSDRRGTRFIDFCDVCGEYAEVIGANPPFLKNIHTPLKEGFYKSDLEFGSFKAKSPLIIVSVETKPLIEAALFKRPEFQEIEA